MPRFSVRQELQNAREKDSAQEGKEERCHQEKGGIGKASQQKKISS
ncbi:MAG: hypothetical protein IH812_02380 [Proteobacteria bacterium]|nr:hypothetical protein [Pseudomonadota bacterium]